MAKIGFVICSRTDSKRIPNKPFQRVNGLPLIEHLISRLKPTGIDIVVAVPTSDNCHYNYLCEKYGITLITGYGADPLARMNDAAKRCGLDTIIRVCHDKVWVDNETLFSAIDLFNRRNLDYVWSDEFCDGSSFEIISAKILDAASGIFKKVEHISYAVKSIAKRQEKFTVPMSAQGDMRFLVDFPEDLLAMEVVMQSLGNKCEIRQAINHVLCNEWISKLNKLPTLTVYTCVYNDDRHLTQCMSSIINQTDFQDIEYIVVDDHSTDKSFEIAAKYASRYPNITVIRNQENIGLASSSNVALSKARGKYIMRLDSDDYLVSKNALTQMVAEITITGKDAIYPNNWFGSLEKIQKGDVHHHCGGTIFRTKAINHVKFTDKLRNHDSLDVFLRAKDQIDIGYLNRPVFFYRQHLQSMSKTNLELRQKTRALLESQISAY